jgi:hypothetical protein
MKTVVHALAILFLSTILFGCPYSSPYAINNPDTAEPINQNLIGTWATFITDPVSNNPEPVKLIVTPNTNTEYNIALLGNMKLFAQITRLKVDTLKGTAVAATVLNKQFISCTMMGRVFIAEVKLKPDGMADVLPLSEHFTSKIIRNSTELKTMLELHYKSRANPMYDDDLALRDLVRVN